MVKKSTSKTDINAARSSLQNVVSRLLATFAAEELEAILEDYAAQTEGLSPKERARFCVMHEDDVDGG